MKPEDLTRFRTASDPQISPDGKRVAFVVTALSTEKDEYLSNVWVVDTDVNRRCLVLPRRPAGSSGLTEEQLAHMVTRDSLFGVGVPAGPVGA